MPDLNSAANFVVSAGSIFLVGYLALWFIKPSEPEERDKEIKLPPDLT